MKYCWSILIVVSRLLFQTANAGHTAIPADVTSVHAKADSVNPLVRQVAADVPGGETGLPSFNYNELSYAIIKTMQSRTASSGIVGYSREGNGIEAFYFPGTSRYRALVIGGVHGSELSSVEVAKSLIQQMQNSAPAFYSVLIIPCLFPDNRAMAEHNPSQIGSIENIGRYSSNTSVDPNRQMPAIGKPFNFNLPVDYMGRDIERENRLLLELIHYYRPQRIVNIHAIREVSHAGVYADPRTDLNGYALGFESDSSLAVGMADFIQQNGGEAPGNHLDGNATALYYTDPPAAAPGRLQQRNLHGSNIPGNRGHGVSLGTWATTAVCEPADVKNCRPAMRLLTMEFPGSKRPADYSGLQQQQNMSRLVDIYAGAIRVVFLHNSCVEDQESAVGYELSAVSNEPSAVSFLK